MPHSAELEAVEAALGSALVAVVAGTRPPVSMDMVRSYLATYFGLGDDLVFVHRHDPEDFIVQFARHEDREAVLRTVIQGAPFSLIWHPW